MANIIATRWEVLRQAKWIALLFIASLSFLGGCTDGEAGRRGAVTGTVTLDGTPIEQGMIVFKPTNGTKGPTAGATIAEGRFRVDGKLGPPIGDSAVEFHATKATGRRVLNRTGEKMIDEILEICPPSLNEKTTIVRKIERGKNEFNFDLTSTGENKKPPERANP